MSHAIAQEYVRRGILGRSGFERARVVEVGVGEALEDVAARAGVPREHLLVSNPDVPRAWGPRGETFLRVPAALWVGVGAAHVGEQGPGANGGPTEYVPENWDLAAGTYTLQEGDTLCQLAYFTGVKNPGGDLPPYTNPITGTQPCPHYISVENSPAIQNNPDSVPAGTVIKLPPKAIANILGVPCPDGYVRSSDGKNCVKSAAGGTKPIQAGMGSGALLLLGALGLGALALVFGTRSEDTRQTNPSKRT
jgi:hypothetical protein